MDFEYVIRTIENAGRACIGLGESLDAENPAIDAVKKSVEVNVIMECFVWRVPLPTDFFTDGTLKFEFIRNELLTKKFFDKVGASRIYVKRQRSIGNTDYQATVNRFGTLKPMLDIEVGDRIVIPKLSLRNNQNTYGEYFTVVDCTSPSLTITTRNRISASNLRLTKAQ